MDETIKICKHNTNGIGYCDILSGYCVEGPCSYEEVVEYAPVVHGRWIEKTATVGKYFECSHCGAHENKHTAIKGYYCWRCGAKMERVNDKCLNFQ